MMYTTDSEAAVSLYDETIAADNRDKGSESDSNSDVESDSE